MNDGTLLGQYRMRNHGDSFREIVQRHLGLLRGVAARTLRAQSGCLGESRLAGWLACGRYAARGSKIIQK